MSEAYSEKYEVEIFRKAKNGPRTRQTYRQNGLLSRVGGPADEMYYGERILEQRYMIQGKRHRLEDEGPAVIYFHREKGFPFEKQWYLNDLEHRICGPSRIIYDDETGALKREIFKQNGEFTPMGKGSVIEYDVETGVAVQEDFLHGLYGDYWVGGVAKISRDRLTGNLLSVLQFDGKDFVERPGLASTLGLNMP